MEKILVANGIILIGKVKELKQELAKLPPQQKLTELCRFNLH